MKRRREDIRSRWGSRRSRDRRPFGGGDDLDVEEVSSEEAVEEGDGVEEGAGLASVSIDVGDTGSGELGARQDPEGPAGERPDAAPVEEAEYRTIDEAVEAVATERAMEGAGRLALEYAARRPTIYGPVYDGAELTKRIIVSREIDGSYYFRVAYQPLEGFTGEPGIEEIFVEKSGTISLRQIVREPRPRWGPTASPPVEAPRPLRVERAARPEPVAEAPRAEAPPAELFETSPEIRQINTAIEYRSPWQVALFTFLFSYLNVMIWFGVTWSEIKREGGGRRMSSVWHGLATLAPLYGWYRGWSHYAAINRLMERARRPRRIRPGIAMAGMASAQAVAWSMFFLPWTWQSGLVVWVTCASLNGLVMILAQGALNDYRE